MVAETLFDEYPGKPPRPRPEKHCKCEIEERKPLHIWRVIHELAHSRVPFTEAWICDRMGYDLDMVAAVCEAAQGEEWIGVARREHPQDTTRAWVGQLKKKR